MSLRAIAIGGITYRSWHVWERNRDVFLKTWAAEFIAPAIEPVIYILAMGLGLGTYVTIGGGDISYIQFLVPGLLAIFPMWAAVGEGLWGCYFRMERQGTYHAMIATPVSIEDVITGEILWGATRLVLSTSLIFLIVIVFTPFYELFTSPWLLAIIPLSLIPGIMFTAMAMSYTSYAVSISSLNYFMTVVLTPGFWFSGAFFPIDRLPEWLQTIAWFVPTTHVVSLYRSFAEGNIGWTTLGDILWLSLVALFFSVFAIRAMRRRLIK